MKQAMLVALTLARAASAVPGQVSVVGKAGPARIAE